MVKMSRQILLFTLCFSLFSTGYGASLDSVKVIERDGIIEVCIFTDAPQYRDFIPNIPNEQRMIAIDFFNTQHNIPSTRINVMKGDLLAIRSSQYTKRVTRVVLDIENVMKYRISRTEKGIIVRLGNLEEQAKARTTKTNSDLDEGIFYSSRDKRDPFKPLVSNKKKSDALLNVERAVLKGIMWSPKERYALLQDEKGKGYTLKEGDKVSGGKLLSIRKKEVIFQLYGFGEVKTIRLKIKSKETE